jgi:D-lactate dehydrogenase (cytochrome)
MARFQSIEGPNGATGDDGAALPDPLAIVGAGVTRSRLNQELRHTGLQFVVDPGADATIGGMVATGASGTTAVRYGTMRENILAVECVVPGQDEAVVVRAGTRALKNSAGYDLVSLMCGSEGTLGVITSITVKLHAIPEHVVAALCVFESLSDAAQAVVTLKLNELPVSRCELLDASSVEVYNTYADKEESSLEVNPTLFLEFQGPSENSLQECVSMTESICKEEFGGSAFEFASSEEDRRALWSARHNLYPACVAFRPGCGGAIVTDACVPLSKFAKLIEETARDVREQGVVGPCFGHAADGNLHCILPVREDDSEEYKRKLQLVHENLIRRTMAAGGSCTGEHGVGYGKLPYLPQQYGPGAPHMMKAIKMAIDPHNIMNPGKVVPC